MTKNIEALLEALSEMTDEELRVAGNAIRRTVEKTNTRHAQSMGRLRVEGKKKFAE